MSAGSFPLIAKFICNRIHIIVFGPAAEIDEQKCQVLFFDEMIDVTCGAFFGRPFSPSLRFL